MIKTLKIQLKPNKKQATKLFQTAGVARFAFNWALNREQENYAQGGKFIQEGALRKEFTRLKSLDEYAWLNESSNNATKQAIKDACGAYKLFFNGYSNFPKFKSKKKSKPSFYVDSCKIRFTGSHVKLEKLAIDNRKNKAKFNWVQLVEKKRIPTDTKYYNPRVSFDGLHWWLSVGVEVEEDFSPPQQAGIGIDLGLKHLAVTSDGDSYGNINQSARVKKLEKRKRRLQRQVSRKYLLNKEGERYKKTCNIKKSEKQLLKLTKRLTNIRQNYTHQITSELVSRKPKFIALEDLNVSGMMKNKYLSRSIAQQRLYEFRKQIVYKACWNAIPVVLVDRWYPSSKTCYQCGHIKKDLKLSDRTYHCKCGNHIDRDLNAAMNLKAYGENESDLVTMPS